MDGSHYFENILTLRDIDPSGKRVFTRVDFNVPLAKDGTVRDDFRVRSSLPTIKDILTRGGRPILASHLGRPKGRRVPEYSMRPVRDVLEGLLGVKVHLAPDCVGGEVLEAAKLLKAGEALLLENLRFHPEEEADDAAFSRELASLADVYVNDAFGTAHRAHASTDGVPRLLQPAVAGLLMEREIQFLGRIVSRPDRPLVAILGGAKISDKIGVLKNLVDKVDCLLVGGGMAHTFLKARGLDIGNSLFEPDSVPVAGEIIALAERRGMTLLLPSDFVCASKVEAGAEIRTGASVPQGFSIVDVGEDTVARFGQAVAGAKTIFWNGPLGVFEIAEFARGTFELARAVARATEGGATSVIGGGDTASALASAGVKDKVTHVSTGGGASLEFIEGKQLPGIIALSRKEARR
jgi:phosphoglycerate kinase